MYEDTVLCHAIRRNNAFAVALFLRCGANPNQERHVSLCYNYAKLFAILSSMHLKTAVSPIVIACEYGFVDILNILFEHGLMIPSDNVMMFAF